MSIERPIPPEVRNAFEMEAELFLKEDARDNRFTPDQLRRSAGMELFTLGLGKLKEGQKLRTAATPAGWIFLTSGTGDTLKLTEVRTSERGPEVVSLFQGAGTAEMRRIAHTIEDKKDTPDGYELSFLRVPGVGVEAFWLKSKDPEKPDLVAPFRRRGRDGRAEKFLEADAFLDEIRDLVPPAPVPRHSRD